MYLPIALHSPLSVLKDQLFQSTGISPEVQVIILLDLTDPDGNRNQLLNGQEHLNLRDIGIRNNSVLTLHPLGITAEQQKRKFDEATEKKNLVKKNAKSAEVKTTTTLNTPVTSAAADHSYNGIVFDLRVKTAHEVAIHSFKIGGMLGRIRVFGRDRGWAEDKPTLRRSEWGGYRESMSTKGWVLLHDEICPPYWDKHYEIKLSLPFKMVKF